MLAFVKRMHAHVRRNWGFDSTFGGLGVLTSVVWQYTFHFESLHFRFLWSLPPVGHGLWLVPAAVWRLNQAALWNMTLHFTHASSHITPRSGAAARHCDVFTLFVCLLCLFMATLVSWSFWYILVCFCKIRQNKDHWVSCPVTFLVMVNMIRRWRQESQGEMKMIETEIKSHY